MELVPSTTDIPIVWNQPLRIDHDMLRHQFGRYVFSYLSLLVPFPTSVASVAILEPSF